MTKQGIDQGLDLPREAEDDVWSLTERERTSLGIEPLPKSLNEAIEIAERSELLAETLGEQVFNFVLRYFPRQFDFISTQVDAFRQQRIQLGLFASLLMIWSALGVFGAITTAVNYAWKVERQPNYLKHKMVAFMMLVASGVLLQDPPSRRLLAASRLTRPQRAVKERSHG